MTETQEKPQELTEEERQVERAATAIAGSTVDWSQGGMPVWYPDDRHRELARTYLEAQPIVDEMVAEAQRAGDAVLARRLANRVAELYPKETPESCLRHAEGFVRALRYDALHPPK